MKKGIALLLAAIMALTVISAVDVVTAASGPGHKPNPSYANPCIKKVLVKGHWVKDKHGHKVWVRAHWVFINVCKARHPAPPKPHKVIPKKPLRPVTTQRPQTYSGPVGPTNLGGQPVATQGQTQGNTNPTAGGNTPTGQSGQPVATQGQTQGQGGNPQTGNTPVAPTGTNGGSTGVNPLQSLQDQLNHDTNMGIINNMRA